MTTKLYTIVLTEEQHTALVGLHYTGTVCARMVNDRKKTPSPREDLYHEWMHNLGIVQSVILPQVQNANGQPKLYALESTPKKVA